MRKRKLNKKFVILLGVVLIILVGGFFAINKFFKSDDVGGKDNKIPEEVKKLKIIDEDSNTRPIAVMINNNHNSWPHAGLQESFLNYEIVAEGGITRIMALYKDVRDVEKIGSVRSSRPYYLDYAMENDAIYAHWGGSDQAYSDIRSLDIDHLDGMTYSEKYFYRDRSANKSLEHTAFTKMSMLERGIEELGLRKTTDKGLVFGYSVDEIDLSTMEGAVKADSVLIDYSRGHNSSYEYDSEKKVYKMSMSGIKHVDAVTKEQYTTKNIITYQVQNKSYDDYGRQKLYNIDKGEGYYITNGYAVAITWEKSSRSSKTIYRYKSTGEKIKLNDGNTWVHIQPKDRELTIKGIESEV